MLKFDQASVGRIVRCANSEKLVGSRRAFSTQAVVSTTRTTAVGMQNLGHGPKLRSVNVMRGENPSGATGSR